MDAGNSKLYFPSIVLQLGLLVFLVYAVIRFFGKRRNAPSMMIGLMTASVVASGLLVLLGLGAGAEIFVEESGKEVGRSIIGTAIWIPYFKVSKRVKATFVK